MKSFVKGALFAAVLIGPMAGIGLVYAQDSILTQVGQSYDLTKTPAGAYTAEKGHSSLFFEASHFGLSAYIGNFNTFDAKLNFDPTDPTKSTLDVTIDVTSVNTRITKLDDHLKSPEFFDVAKFPTATFKSTKIEKLTDKTGKITGDLTLHGVTKPVTLDVTFNGGAPNAFSKLYTLGFSATTKIKRSDFGISTFLPMLGDEVALRIETEFAKAP